MGAAQQLHKAICEHSSDGGRASKRIGNMVKREKEKNKMRKAVGGGVRRRKGEKRGEKRMRKKM